jgi:hypothetical protein
VTSASSSSTTEAVGAVPGFLGRAVDLKQEQAVEQIQQFVLVP